MNLLFVVFQLFVFQPNSMCKLIHNELTCKLKLITKTMTVYMYMYANKQSRLCFYVLDCYFVVHLWKLYQNSYVPQAQGTLVNVQQCSLYLWQIIVNYSYFITNCETIPCSFSIMMMNDVSSKTCLVI